MDERRVQQEEGILWEHRTMVYIFFNLMLLSEDKLPITGIVTPQGSPGYRVQAGLMGDAARDSAWCPCCIWNWRPQLYVLCKNTVESSTLGSKRAITRLTFSSKTPQ